MKNPDRRFIVETDGSTVVAVSLKCGFATLNHALVQSNPSPRHHYSMDPAQDVAAAERVVLFVRDPQSRFKSFFRNWIVDKAYGDDNNQTVYKNTSRYLRSTDIDRLANTPTEERHSAEFLKFYLNAIGPAVMNERHMAPQWFLLQKYGIPESAVTEVKNYRENIDFLESQYGLKPEIRNITRSEGADPLDCPELDAFCRVMYARDYEMFGRYF